MLRGAHDQRDDMEMLKLGEGTEGADDTGLRTPEGLLVGTENIH